MTDKDITERGVFKEKFDHASLAICLFHTLRTFKREVTINLMLDNICTCVTCDKMKLTQEEVSNARQLLMKMAYARNEILYQDIYEKLLSSCPKRVVDYFNKNWHPIRQEWTLMCSKHESLLNRTYNRLECMNGKLKTIIKPFSSLNNFIQNFFILINSLRNERNKDMAKSVLTTRSSELGIDEALYSKRLQPYAFNFILKNMKEVENTVVTEVDGQFYYSYEGILHRVSQETCDCNFWP
nr:uncharacterized protein LOC122273738 [Parasteatoda tepidariorum]